VSNNGNGSFYIREIINISDSRKDLTIKNFDDILRAGNKLKRKCGSEIRRKH
jgi:hypothetical protein